MQFIEEDEDGGQLVPIETEEEWDMIEELLEEFAENTECGCGEDCSCDDDCECEEGCSCSE